MAANQTLIHYALDLETPPLIACESPDVTRYSPFPTDVTCPDCMTHEQFPRLQVQPHIRAYTVLMNAADLLSDGGENTEYDRAIIELTSSLIGTDDTDLMARILRSLATGE
jgi:hypothetical protein